MAENTGTEKGAGAAVVPANGAVAAAKPATPAKGTMSVAKKGTALPECQLITRLEDRGADSLRKVILQLSGNDPLFVEKFAECCKMQVNRHWKRNEKKEWTNPFLLIPLNSQLEALYKCASRKILPDGYNANLVPYIGRDEKKVEVVIDYKGLVDCAIREGIILDADAKEVCENDTFEWNCGEVTRWTFDFRKPRGKICGYCGWVIMPDNRKKWHYMDCEEISQVRACAKTQKIWDKWVGEMSKKTVIRRMFKTIRNTPALVAMMDVDNDSFDLDGEEEATPAKVTPTRSVYGDPNRKPALRAPAAKQLADARARNVSHGDPLADEPEAGVEVIDPQPEPIPARQVEKPASVQEAELFT